MKTTAALFAAATVAGASDAADRGRHTHYVPPTPSPTPTYPKLWAQRDFAAGTVNLTFGGAPHAPGAVVATAVDGVAASAQAASATANRTSLPLAPAGSDGSVLSAALGETYGEKFLLEASGAGGTHAAVKYWANADAVTTPNDWFVIQDLATAELEVTLRDPYMAPQSAASRRLLELSSLSVDNQCEQGAPVQDGNACVVAVVRFKGQLLMDANVTITTWSPRAGDAQPLRASTSKYGVTIVQVPLPGSDVCAGAVAGGRGCPYFASVQHTDASTPTPTTHIATTTGVTQR